MKKIHTHYDNLKVARSAPREVISAAYKTLSQKYHPDRNAGNREAARILALINAAYEVLSDSAKRREHDLWIARMEGAVAGDDEISEKNGSSPHRSTNASGDLVLFELLLRLFGRLKAPVVRLGGKLGSAVIGIITFVLVIFLAADAVDRFLGKSSPPPGPEPYAATPVRTAYVRPSSAPNGQPWPAAAGYVRGYQRSHANGLSTVTVDNSRNDSDVFVKLVTLDRPNAYPVRQFYIPAFGSFTLKNVTAGSYDIRYRDLSDGGLSRTEAFTLKETPTYNGTQYSNITMTLYKVQHGNMETYSLSEAEF